MRIILVIFAMACTFSSLGQAIRPGLPMDYQSRKILPDQYVREADVMWSKTVWRLIDLRQKKNQHLYYPTRPQGSYMSLSDVLFDLVKHKGISIYDENMGDEFALTMTSKDMDERMGKKEERIQVSDPADDSIKEIVIPGEVNSSDIKRYLIKEVWFFDKNRGQVDVRIIGLCPVREYYRDEEQEEPVYKLVGWFYMPEIEKQLAHYPAMNGMNEAWKWTYYDIFKNRYFKSVVVQVGNMYDNRAINEYAMGTEALQESQRIEEQIRNFEQDLWSY